MSRSRSTPPASSSNRMPLLANPGIPADGGFSAVAVAYPVIGDASSVASSATAGLTSPRDGGAYHAMPATGIAGYAPAWAPSQGGGAASAAAAGGKSMYPASAPAPAEATAVPDTSRDLALAQQLARSQEQAAPPRRGRGRGNGRRCRNAGAAASATSGSASDDSDCCAASDNDDDNDDSDVVPKTPYGTRDSLRHGVRVAARHTILAGIFFAVLAGALATVVLSVSGPLHEKNINPRLLFPAKGSRYDMTHSRRGRWWDHFDDDSDSDDGSGSGSGSDYDDSDYDDDYADDDGDRSRLRRLDHGDDAEGHGNHDASYDDHFHGDDAHDGGRHHGRGRRPHVGGVYAMAGVIGAFGLFGLCGSRKHRAGTRCHRHKPKVLLVFIIGLGAATVVATATFFGAVAMHRPYEVACNHVCNFMDGLANETIVTGLFVNQSQWDAALSSGQLEHSEFDAWRSRHDDMDRRWGSDSYDHEEGSDWWDTRQQCDVHRCAAGIKTGWSLTSLVAAVLLCGNLCTAIRFRREVQGKKPCEHKGCCRRLRRLHRLHRLHRQRGGGCGRCGHGASQVGPTTGVSLV